MLPLRCMTLKSNCLPQHAHFCLHIKQDIFCVLQHDDLLDCKRARKLLLNIDQKPHHADNPSVDHMLNPALPSPDLLLLSGTWGTWPVLALLQGSRYKR